MKNPANDQPARSSSDDVVDRLKTVQPRKPQLDWGAIRSAVSEEEPGAEVANSIPSSVFRISSSTVAWCSGLATGTLITALAMQWFVLSKLQSRIEMLEQSAAVSLPNTFRTKTEFQKAVIDEPAWTDINAILDSSAVSLGSFRGRGNRLTYSQSTAPILNLKFLPTSDDLLNTPSRKSAGMNEGSVVPPKSSAYRVLLQRELQQQVL